jgi:hypothetical protein
MRRNATGSRPGIRSIMYLGLPLLGPFEMMPFSTRRLPSPRKYSFSPTVDEWDLMRTLSSKAQKCGGRARSSGDDLVGLIQRQLVVEDQRERLVGTIPALEMLVDRS